MNVFLVTRRKPINELPWLWRWAIRLVYFRTGWASDYSVEYQGVYTDEAEARWAASGTGMSYTELPLNGLLPPETVQYGVHDFPLSDASMFYRQQQMPMVAVPVGLLDEAVKVSNEMHDSAQGKCAKAT